MRKSTRNVAPVGSQVSREAREQRDHLMKLDKAGKIELPPIGAHARRTEISEFVTSWRVGVRYCKSVDGYRE